MSDGTGPMIFLQSDLYTRNKIIGSAIGVLKEHLGLPSLKVLDVGGRGARMREFLSPSEEVLVLDLRPPESEHGNYIIGDIANAPFANGKFNVVIASDLLEHIKPTSRESVLAEMLRISSHYVILGAPFFSPEVARAESLVNSLHLSLRGCEHPWLKEHIENGLPNEEELLTYLRNNDIGFRKIATNNILNWLLTNFFLQTASFNLMPKSNLDAVFQFYNLNFQQLGDGIEPTYRRIYVISRKSKIPESVAPDSSTNLVKFEELLSMMFNSMVFPSTVDIQGDVIKHLELYRSREDLQEAYPEAASGDIKNLFLWAANALLRKHNEAVSERDALSSKLKYAQVELDSIKSSFGYRFMRLYNAMIDHVLPDGTRRREFLKIVITSLKIASSQGIRSLLHMAWEKLKRRELKIVRPTPEIKIEALRKTAQIVESEEKPITISPQGRVLLYCDTPRLSLLEPTKVSDTIVVSGWALSDRGIRKIEIYLNDSFVGLANYGIFRFDIGVAHPEFPNSYLSGFRKLIDLDQSGKEGPYRLKIVALSDLPPARIEGLIEIDRSVRAQPIGPAGEELPGKPFAEKPSVIILTRWPPADFEQTLEQIRTQKGINDPEIIIVNSGNFDLDSLARKYKATVYNISPEQFDHATTRNYAAEKAGGDYVIFMTDDAIPADQYLLHSMIDVLKSDRTIAAATARQIPRSDADLMYCQAMWHHYEKLGINRNRIVGSHDLDKMSPAEKRAICQIDDVCSCFRRNVFLQYRYAKGLGYAEDLELGIRLVKDGFKIAQLFKTGVIHSHNRPPSYWLRRSYVDFKVLHRLLNYEVAKFKFWSVESPNDLLSLALELYRSLNVAIDNLISAGFCEYDVQKVFKTIKSQIQRSSEILVDTNRRHQDLSEILEQITKLLDYRREKSQRRNPLIDGYLLSLETFKEWFMNSHKDLNNLETEFVETLYKLLAVQIGNWIGQYAAYTSERGYRDEKIAALDSFLSKGV